MKDDSPTRRRQSNRETRAAAFTLVEMLTVMGIISVLIAVALPNLRGLNQTAARRNAVTNVMNALDRARIMAVSEGRATYVAFACPTSISPQVNSALWGRAYAIFQDKDNINFQPVQITPWLYLPNSMAFKINGGFTSVTSRPLSTNDPAFPLLPVAGSGKATLPYLKFDSTGMVDIQDTNYLRILMFPGSVSPAGTEVPTQNGGSTTAAFFEEIDLNPMTGRARYISDPADNLATTTSSSN